jgi:AraC-like ligand binding domain
MSHTGQLDRSYIRPYEQAPRPLVGYARDYVAGHGTGWHQHPRAQLLYATAGVMRVETCPAMFIVPPGTGLWVPADTSHVTRMPAGLSMRALFLREDAARAGPRCVTVVAVSPLLRELILAACAEGVVWDEEGPVRHVVALALHEISRPQRARSRCRHAMIRACAVSPRPCWQIQPIQGGWTHLQ